MEYGFHDNILEQKNYFFDIDLILKLKNKRLVAFAKVKTSFKECQKNNWLKTKDWTQYDMTRPIMKTLMKDNEVKKLMQGLYKSSLTPRFLVRKIFPIRGFNDIKFLLRAGKYLISHLFDFRGKK